MRLHKPIGTFLLLWPALWALWIAGNGQPNAHVIVYFILGVIVMRAAGCVINDFADRHIDKHVARTQRRPLTCGAISSGAALVLFFMLCTIALLIVLQLNRLTQLLALPALALAIAYPFMKRITNLPQCVLGLAFSFSIPMAFAALQNQLPPMAGWLFLANTFWTIAYDTQYALVDREDDKKIGVRSTAILFGRHAEMMIGLLNLAFITIFALIGWHSGFKYPFYIGIALAGMLLAYQQQLIHQHTSTCCFRAFLNNAWVGGLLFLGIVLG